MNLSNGKIWPYAIGISIVLIFGACVATVIVASTLPVQKSDKFMMDYHDADANANEIIKAQIAFDQKYKIEYLTQGLSTKGTSIRYKINDADAKAINDAKIKVVLTRPNQLQYDIALENPAVSEGVYTFENVTLPLEGRWDVMAKIEIGQDSRYYNLKADTRNTTFKEY
ncbi:MAG: FixH family protein [Thiovulaceae bacterium]|jgi:nitrogen fixation protein FixH|nr:FixH family protein [Sulfurimonadaceae bacterium]